MSTLGSSKIALGLITRYFHDPVPILRFLDNAMKFGHHIDQVIVAYSHGVKQEAVASIEERTGITMVVAHGDDNMRGRLLFAGLSVDEVDGLLDVPSWPRFQEVPYGAYRNAVLIQALLDGLDYLLFFDTDVQPVVLTALHGDKPFWQEIDFVGTHMASLSEEHIAVTTSEYSGYYIIPPRDGARVHGGLSYARLPESWPSFSRTSHSNFQATRRESGSQSRFTSAACTLLLNDLYNQRCMHQGAW